MNIKITALALMLAIGFPVAAQAQNTNGFDNNVQTPSQPGVDVQTPSQPSVDVQTPSQPGFEVQTPSATPSEPDVNFQEQDNELTQNRRTRTRRTRTTSSSLDSKYYAGGNLGLFVPFNGDNSDDDIGIEFGGLFGYKVNKNISAELELFNARGGSDVDDLGYSIFGASANGVYRYYFNPDNSKSLYAFGGLGLGFGVASATGDVADDLEDDGVDTSRTGFLLQTKAGVGYPLSDNLDLFGQARYANVFIGEEDNVENSGEDGNGISFDLGATYNF
jgi:Outer membrane protein beta-barrel domain